MKKLIVVLSLCLLLVCSIFVKPKYFSLNDYFDGGVLYTYTKRPINETSICLANTYMSLNSTGADKSEIIGESLYFENLEVGSALTTLKAKVKFTEYLDNQQLTIIYAYTSLIPTYKTVNNYKINLQISVANEYAIIGWPLIYGSF